ncbi:MAG: hypothetical protein IJW48_05125 [Clostridia bacterium]|nr:hypothetical protein [Clostridia bacterium]
MKNENTEKIRERLLSLIEAEYDSDAAFERAVGLREKTVNNWRRGRSASFMKMLGELSEIFRMNIGELMDIPLSSTSSELSEDELRLLTLYRKTRTMPQKMRSALGETLDNTINMYITAHQEMKRNERRLKQKDNK